MLQSRPGYLLVYTRANRITYTPLVFISSMFRALMKISQPKSTDEFEKKVVKKRYIFLFCAFFFNHLTRQVNLVVSPPLMFAMYRLVTDGTRPLPILIARLSFFGICIPNTPAFAPVSPFAADPA